ncbi:hypothetical protein HDU82_004220, partial [Entophlyctis luteolus]
MALWTARQSPWRKLQTCAPPLSAPSWHLRSLVQQSRHADSFGMESFVGLLAGGIMGISAGGIFSGFFKYPYQELGSAPNYWFVAMHGMLVGVLIAVASAPAGVKVF